MYHEIKPKWVKCEITDANRQLMSSLVTILHLHVRANANHTGCVMFAYKTSKHTTRPATKLSNQYRSISAICIAIAYQIYVLIYFMPQLYSKVSNVCNTVSAKCHITTFHLHMQHIGFCVVDCYLEDQARPFCRMFWCYVPTSQSCIVCRWPNLYIKYLWNCKLIYWF